MKLAAVLLVVGHGAVAQDCPTAADLDEGRTIILSSSVESLSMENRMTANGLMITTVMPINEKEVRTDSFFDHPLALPKSAPGVRTEYEPALAPLDGLDQLRTWSAELTVFNGTQVAGEVTHSLEITGLGHATLSGCDYDIWRIDEALTDNSGAVNRRQKVYAPALGLVIAETGLNAAGDVVGGLSFDQIAVN